MANKKSYILIVLKIMRDHSDEHNPLTHQRIIDYAKNEYGVEMERKAVASSLEILGEEPFNYDINKVDRKGFYLGERELDASDILYLNTYLLGARNIPASFAKRISASLLNTLSEHYRKNFHQIYFMDKIDRITNKHLPYTIDAISHALRHNKMISFKYYEYDVKGNLVARKKDGIEHIYYVSPHFLINSLGKFYLLATPRHSPETKITSPTPFRVEFIDNITELKETSESIKKIPGYENFSISDYLNNHPYPTGDNTPITLKLKVNDPRNGIRYIKDWFGNAAEIKVNGGDCIAKIKTTMSPAFWWIMQYSEHFVLLEPKNLKEKIRDAAKNILDKYN